MSALVDSVGFLVEATSHGPARFATLAEALALVRFLNKRGLDCQLSVCGSGGVDASEVVYHLSDHAASPRDRLRRPPGDA